MAAFSDALDLRTAVVEQVGRPDIADVFPRLVSLAETTINRRLRLHDMVASAVLTLVAGKASLPLDLAEIIGIFDARGLELIAQPMQATQSQGLPFYSVAGGVVTVKGYSGDLTLTCYAMVPTIAGSMTSTSWLLDRHPDVYLYGVGYEAAKYLRDVEGAQAAKVLFDMALDDAAADDNRVRYARARVRVDGVTP